jgi:hypothetical protein
MQITPFTMNHAQRTARLGFKAENNLYSSEIDRIFDGIHLMGVNEGSLSTAALAANQQYFAKPCNKVLKRATLANVIKKMPENSTRDQIADAIYPEGAIRGRSDVEEEVIHPGLG